MVALIALFVISVKLVMPIVVAVVLILLTLIVMFGNIKIRTRPVLMTAFAISVGMLPVAQGSAVGLERLAPLGAVAIMWFLFLFGL